MPLVIAVAAGLERHSLAIDSIWPGWWPDAHSYAFHPFDSGTLVITTAQLARRPLLDTVRVPKSLFLRAYLVGERPSYAELGRGFDTEFKVGRLTMTAVSPYGYYGPITDSLRATTFFLLHEAFHALQDRRGWSDSVRLPKLRVAPRGEPSLFASPTVQKGLAMEREALQKAVLAPTLIAARWRYRNYLAQRDRRLEIVAPQTRRGEAFAERIEGVPTYVAFFGVAAASGRGTPEAVNLIARFLVDARMDVDLTDPVIAYERWHIYAVGAAKTLLLSRVRSDWRELVDQGFSLDELLEEWAEGST